MPQSNKVTVTYLTYLTYDGNGENEQEWEVSCSVYPGSPGTYNDPPDGGEVCVQTGYKDLAKRLNLRSASAPAPIRSFNAYSQGQAAGRSLGLGGGKGIAGSKSRIDA